MGNEVLEQSGDGGLSLSKILTEVKKFSGNFEKEREFAREMRETLSQNTGLKSFIEDKINTVIISNLNTPENILVVKIYATIFLGKSVEEVGGINKTMNKEVYKSLVPSILAGIGSKVDKFVNSVNDKNGYTKEGIIGKIKDKIDKVVNDDNIPDIAKQRLLKDIADSLGELDKLSYEDVTNLRAKREDRSWGVEQQEARSKGFTNGFPDGHYVDTLVDKNFANEMNRKVNLVHRLFSEPTTEIEGQRFHSETLNNFKQERSNLDTKYGIDSSAVISENTELTMDHNTLKRYLVMKFGNMFKLDDRTRVMLLNTSDDFHTNFNGKDINVTQLINDYSKLYTNFQKKQVDHFETPRAEVLNGRGFINEVIGGEEIKLPDDFEKAENDLEKLSNSDLVILLDTLAGIIPVVGDAYGGKQDFMDGLNRLDSEGNKLSTTHGNINVVLGSLGVVLATTGLGSFLNKLLTSERLLKLRFVGTILKHINNRINKGAMKVEGKAAEKLGEINDAVSKEGVTSKVETGGNVVDLAQRKIDAGKEKSLSRFGINTKELQEVGFVDNVDPKDYKFLDTSMWAKVGVGDFEGIGKLNFQRGWGNIEWHSNFLSVKALIEDPKRVDTMFKDVSFIIEFLSSHHKDLANYPEYVDIINGMKFKYGKFFEALGTQMELTTEQKNIIKAFNITCDNAGLKVGEEVSRVRKMIEESKVANESGKFDIFDFKYFKDWDKLSLGEGMELMQMLMKDGLLSREVVLSDKVRSKVAIEENLKGLMSFLHKHRAEIFDGTTHFGEKYMTLITDITTQLKGVEAETGGDLMKYVSNFFEPLVAQVKDVTDRVNRVRQIGPSVVEYEQIPGYIEDTIKYKKSRTLEKVDSMEIVGIIDFTNKDITTGFIAIERLSKVAISDIVKNDNNLTVYIENLSGISTFLLNIKGQFGKKDIAIVGDLYTESLKLLNLQLQKLVNSNKLGDNENFISDKLTEFGDLYTLLNYKLTQYLKEWK